MASPAFLVSKIFQGRTPQPPFQTNVLNIQSNIAQSTQRLVRSEVFNEGSGHKVGGGWGGERSSTTLICDNLAMNWLAKDLLYH